VAASPQGTPGHYDEVPRNERSEFATMQYILLHWTRPRWSQARMTEAILRLLLDALLLLRRLLDALLLLEYELGP